MKINYQLKLDEIIKGLGDDAPKVLLQSCCGPCSSYVLEYLTKHFRVTVLYYNPNIYPETEYFKRLSEQKKLIERLETERPVSFMECSYDSEAFYKAAEGFEKEREGGSRCERCFILRLEETARLAKENGFDYFGTTLTVSPHKNAQLINKLGEKIGDKYGVKFLYSDFKKKNGYKRSIELSKELDIYRQDYCGCEFSLRDSENVTTGNSEQSDI